MHELAAAVDGVAAATNFSGVVRVDFGTDTVVERAYAWADRAHHVPNTVATQFGIASGVKGLTASVVVSLVADGRLGLDTTARSVLGADLPLIDDRVTVEHLLAHRSGIGDYIDEDAGTAIDAYVLTVPPHVLRTTDDYLPVLDGRPQRSTPGERFAYCNSGFVVLALIAERVGGAPFADLVARRVIGPADMRHTMFLPLDALPGRAAIGYLDRDGLRTNVLHLPVVGSGDGGIYSTVADVHAFWIALFSGAIVPSEWRDEMVRPRSTTTNGSLRYGLGFWLHATGPAVMLEGFDAGVSFRTRHDPELGVTATVIANTSDGAWPIARALDEHLDGE